MKQIITIQHTQSIHHTNGMVGSWTDCDLSELGIEQAERIGQKLAKQLSGHKIVMYASDLLRAKHTAEIVAKHMGITPNIRTELRERNLGKCFGKSVQWLRENIEVQEKTIDDRMFSDAESRRDEWNRLKPLFDEIMASNDECIIVVSHGDLLSVWNTIVVVKHFCNTLFENSPGISSFKWCFPIIVGMRTDMIVPYVHISV